MKSVLPIMCNPTVCAVEKNYVIAIPTERKMLIRIGVGQKNYYYHTNGIRIYDAPVQMFKIPMSELNEAKKYTLYYKDVSKGLNSKRALEEKSLTYSFKPIEKSENIKISLISDCHGRVTAPIESAKFFEDKPDLLILNGDVISKSEKSEELYNLYRIASEITKGEIPVIISRGNHDLRGKLAQKMQSYIPLDNGKTYFTARLGSLWFLVMDCGEDKADSHFEYSGSVCCEMWRREELEFLSNMIQKKEYLAEGIEKRIVISHVPFSIRDMSNMNGRYNNNPFDIENELFTSWCDLISETIHPNMFLSGHRHESRVIREKDALNTRKINCDIVVAGVPGGTKNKYNCANLIVKRENCEVYFCDENGKAFLKEIIDY